MKSKVISLAVCLLAFAIVVSYPTVALAQSWDRNEIVADRNLLPIPDDAIWDVQFSFDVTAASGAAGNAGAEFDGTHFYTTRWASNLIHEYDLTGTMTKQFSIAGVSGLRDLAYDGTYFYGGAAGGTIWQMDFTAQTLIGSISGGFQSRAIAYDSDLDVFYCSNWGDPVWVVDRTGAILSTFNLVTTTSTYGLAYDNVTAGGPYLWVFDQGGGGVVHQWDLAAGAYTGVTHDVGADFPATAGIAGGLWFATDFMAGTTTLGCLLQGVPDMMICYEIEAAGFTLAVSPDPLIGGQAGAFIVTNGAPNTNTYLGYSLAGPGSTYVPFLQVTLGLASPKKGAGPTMTDGSGGLTWKLNVPKIKRKIWLQAAQKGQVTNVVATAIQ